MGTCSPFNHFNMLQEITDIIVPEIEKLRSIWKEFSLPIENWKITIEFYSK